MQHSCLRNAVKLDRVSFSLGTERVSVWQPSKSTYKVVSMDHPRHPYKYFRIYYRPKGPLTTQPSFIDLTLIGALLFSRDFDSRRNYA